MKGDSDKRCHEHWGPPCIESLRDAAGQIRGCLGYLPWPRGLWATGHHQLFLDTLLRAQHSPTAEQAQMCVLSLQMKRSGSQEDFLGLALAEPGPDLPLCVAGVRCPTSQPWAQCLAQSRTPELDGNGMKHQCAKRALDHHRRNALIPEAELLQVPEVPPAPGARPGSVLTGSYFLLAA